MQRYIQNKNKKSMLFIAIFFISVLSALAHWSSIFGETEFLPLLSFPFIKLFENNQLICFEVIATVVFNWCQLWFMYFPNPPVNVLGII